MIKELKKEDINDVKSALVRFYMKRPDEYGLLERNQNSYNMYASLIDKHAKTKQTTVLDIGSGTWRIPETIAQKGFNKVIGVDFFSDEKLIKYRAEIKESNVFLEQFSGDRLPFEDASFGIVTSLCVVEHIIDVENMFSEMDRVLAPGGRLFIVCPNWSGINISFLALKSTLFKQKRVFQYETFFDAISAFFLSIKWYFEAIFSSNFIMIYPRMKDGEIEFLQSDDDAVHLCQPVSLKKFFKNKGYKVVQYNRGSGDTLYSKIFNYIFPSFSTTNEIVLEKKHNNC